MKRKSVLFSAAMSLSMVFSQFPVYALGAGEAAETQADETVQPDYILFDSEEYVTTLNGVYSGNVSYSVYPADAYSNFGYVVQDPSIAEVNEYGMITPKAAGTTAVTITAPNGVSASTKITVLSGDYADYINVPYPSITLDIGESYQLRASLSSDADPGKTEFADDSITWSEVGSGMFDDGKQAVKIDGSGKVTALAYGTAMMMALTKAGKKNYVTVDVAPKIRSLSFSENTPRLYVKDGWLNLSDYVEFEPAESAKRQIRFTSSNPDVIRADETFVAITGIGKATVTVASVEDPSVTGTIELEVYEPVKPTSIRRKTSENETFYWNCEYPESALVVQYEPERADTSTKWSSSNEGIIAVSGNSPAAYYRYYTTGGPVTITAASESDPGLSVDFSVNIVDEPLPAGTFTSSVDFGIWDPQKRQYTNVQTDPEVYTVKVGDRLGVQCNMESDKCLPYADLNDQLEESLLLSAGNAFNMMSWVSGSHIEKNPAKDYYAKTPGEETYTFNGKTYTIRVVDPDAPEEKDIHEVNLLSDMFITPSFGTAFVWPEDLRTPAGSDYMTPAEFNETQHGQGVGDTAGSLWVGTLDNIEMRVLWDDVYFGKGEAYVYRISVFAKEGCTFADDVTGYLNGIKADRVTIGDQALRLEFQFGPFEEDTSGLRRIYFFSNEYEIPYGKQMVLIAHTDPDDYSGRLTFTSSDPNIVTCNDNLLVAKNVGTATVTASAENGMSASCTIRVLFSDVANSSQYFYDPVYWAVDNNITVGAGGAGKFSPGNPCTREQIVTFLWRLQGEPEPESYQTFTDVKPTDWFYKPISWAASKGITVGLNDGTGRFGVGQPCTREQCVTFLHRTAGKPAVGEHQEFTDVASDRYFYDAISWAASKKITVGLNDGTGRFGVGQTCTRAMIVTFLSRYAHLDQNANSK